MPAPSLPGVPSIAFLVVRGASGSLSSSVIALEFLFPQKMQDDSSYPRVEDNSLVTLIQSLSPMHIDPLNLCFSPLADWASLVVGRALGFDAESEAHRLQRCDYPRVEDTCTVEHRPDTHATIDDAHRAPGASGFEDATDIKCALWNASISGCKDALPAFRSIDDDDNDDEGGGED